MKRRSFFRTLGLSVALITAFAGVVLLAGYLSIRGTAVSPAIRLVSTQGRVEIFRRLGAQLPSVPVSAGEEHHEFDVPAATGSSPLSLPQSFTVENEEFDTQEFISESATTALLVVHENTIVYERYFRGYDRHDRPTSWSVAKSFVSPLIGQAVDRGDIGSIDDRVTEYVPDLAGSGYEDVTIRHALTMSSGVRFTETYWNPFADVYRMPILALLRGRSIRDYIVELPSRREPGVYHDYISSDTVVLSWVLEEATGERYARLLERDLWQPAGMASDATVNVDPTGAPFASFGINATARDYARFGLLYLNDGRMNGRQAVPAEWVRRSVVPESRHQQPGWDNPYSCCPSGYGYHWWIPPEPDSDFAAMGIFGQMIYVHRPSRTVIVKTGAGYSNAAHDLRATRALFRGIVNELTNEAPNGIRPGRP